MRYMSEPSERYKNDGENCNLTTVDMSGTVVVIDRRDQSLDSYCPPSIRARYAQAAGAIAVIMHCSAEDPNEVTDMGFTEADSADIEVLCIPIFMISEWHGRILSDLDLPIVVRYGEEKDIDSIVEAIEISSEIMISSIEFSTNMMSALEVQSHYYTENARLEKTGGPKATSLSPWTSWS